MLTPLTWPQIPWRATAIAGIGLLTLTAAGGSLLPAAAPAIQYADGTVGFSYPLRLTDSYATRNLVYDGSVTYYLTFEFPAAAAEPLDYVVINLEQGFDPLFRFRPEHTEAFVNTPDGRLPLPLGEITQDREASTLTVAFDPPAAPGAPITLALRPQQNPRFAGVYLFGATAYPVGETVRPTFMGYARLSFYERDSYRWP
jgi:hypothetical protein